MTTLQAILATKMVSESARVHNTCIRCNGWCGACRGICLTCTAAIHESTGESGANDDDIETDEEIEPDISLDQLFADWNYTNSSTTCSTT